MRRNTEQRSLCVEGSSCSRAAFVFGSTFFHLASALRPMFMSAGPVVLFEWHLLGIWPLVYFILYCSSLKMWSIYSTSRCFWSLRDKYRFNFFHSEMTKGDKGVCVSKKKSMPSPFFQNRLKFPKSFETQNQNSLARFSGVVLSIISINSHTFGCIASTGSESVSCKI